MNSTQAQPEAAPEAKSFCLPHDFSGGMTLKAGDEIRGLFVVGHTSDGETEVEYRQPKEDGGWEKDFDQSMAPADESAEAAPPGGDEMSGEPGT